MIRRIWKDCREIWIYPALLVLALAAWMALPNPVHSFGKAIPPSLDTPEKIFQNEYWRCYRSIKDHFWLVTSFPGGFIQYGVLLLAAVALFGSEFKYASMGRLLAQPVSRRRLWYEKSAAFGLVALIVLAANLLVCVAAFRQMRLLDRLSAEQFHGLFATQGHPNYFAGYSMAGEFLQQAFGRMVIVLLICLAALANGLTFSLFIRQPHTAFWAALVFPVFVLVFATFLDTTVIKPTLGFSFIEFLAGEHFGSDEMFTCVLLWSLAVYPIGWLKFKRLEV